MGYQRPTLRLVFDDPEMEGLTVRARRLTIGRFTDLLNLSGADLKDESTRVELTKVVMEGVIGWDLEDEDGVPVPVTPEGFLGQDTPFVQAMTRAMIQANRGIPAPLERLSPAGGQSLEQSMPMEVSSPSPEN
jgi:hypothetical protein